jgi:hypothetical protein
MEKIIDKIIEKILQERQGNIIYNPGISLFNQFIKEILSYHDTPAQNISELNRKIRRNNFKGPLFEEFCKKYFKYIFQADSVWLLSELPAEIIQELSLTKRDFGIDLIMKNKGKYYPIQCKLKSPKKLPKDKEKKHNYLNVTWKELSTFYALCNRTGPIGGWEKLIVFTNTNYINRKGRKNANDKSICYATLNKLNEEDFKKLKGVNSSGNKLNIFNSELDEEEIRKKRLEFFSVNNNKSNFD